MVQRPVRHSGTFVYDASQCAWRIAPIRFNNVRLSPLICIQNISGLLRPRILKPLHFRASRNEVSNVGTIEVGLHTTQVPNSTRNETELSYSCSHSQYTVCGAFHSWMSCLNVSNSFPPMPRQIEVWAAYNLTFVLLRFALLQRNDSSSVHCVGTLLSAIWNSKTC